MSIKEAKKNYLIFRDCLAELIESQLNRTSAAKSTTRRKRRKPRSPPPPDSVNVDLEKGGNELDDGDAGEFVDYLAEEIFNNLPQTLQDLSPSTPGTDGESQSWEDIESLSELISPTVSDSLEAYSLIDLPATLSSILPTYIKTATEPVIWKNTRTTACELCDRDWIPLTYHHLIPRSTHGKALKRGWHVEQELNRVAWLCAACHRFVHRVEPNEELAKHWDTVEKLKGREDVQRFVDWVGTVRWKLR